VARAGRPRTPMASQGSPGHAANDTGEGHRLLPVRRPATPIRCHDPKPTGSGPYRRVRPASRGETMK